MSRSEKVQSRWLVNSKSFRKDKVQHAPPPNFEVLGTTEKVSPEILSEWSFSIFRQAYELLTTEKGGEKERGRERERRRVGDRTWKRGIRPPSIRALSEYPTMIFRARRELRQPWRRWQRKRQKTNKQTNKKTIGSISKTTTLRVKHTVWYISLSSLQNFDNFKFYSSLFTDPLKIVERAYR